MLLKPQTCHVGLLVHVVLVLLSLSGCDNNPKVIVRTEVVEISSPEEIELLTSTLVKPVIYKNIAGLKRLPVQKAKQKFISAILPSILIAKHQIEQSRKRIERLQQKDAWSSGDSLFYARMCNVYKATGINELMLKIGTLPTSIVLAQAAVESGWGQSRFFTTANNVFGVWSFNAAEPRIVAAKTRKKKMIYLRAYQDISHAVTNYFEILSRARAYRSLRKARLKSNDPFELLPHLKYFSERRISYVLQLQRVIEKNNLTKYDAYQIDPAYLAYH